MPATICREKYFNYGSYLRSRGYDKEICNLVSNIENGNIKVGSFIPNGTNGGTINGNLKIDGTLEATGGTSTTPSIITSFGIKSTGLLDGMSDVSLCSGGTTSSLAFFGRGSIQGTSNVNIDNMVIDASGAIDLSGVAGSIIGQNTTFKPIGGSDEYSINHIVQILYNYGLLK